MTWLLDEEGIGDGFIPTPKNNVLDLKKEIIKTIKVIKEERTKLDLLIDEAKEIIYVISEAVDVLENANNYLSKTD